MEHGLKDIAFYVQNFSAGSRQAARGAHICETSLFNATD